ncbi:phage tail assembly protein [Commensalibacter oyaizuii]|uniref:Phage tail assembly protein n=1 Tax=Commensalibacter oyaizuii TaxID=3043873 RepID=A0ABT6Q3C2_9PROT|nr:phage tail assembly protein [Commensalibacter sp. TBRC 16381]MDI2091624.1 phage tail assembly protein [Commensalibacter sp. TBRC 16381]
MTQPVMNTKIISLDRPVRVGDRDYTELKLREPIVNEVIQAFKTMAGKQSSVAAYDAQLILVASVSEMPIQGIEELPGRILDQAIDFVMSFQDMTPCNEPYDQWDMELIPPLQLSNGETLSEIALQEPTVKQRKMAMKQFDHYGQTIVGGLEFQVSLLTQVSGQKLASILKLPISQFTKASGYLLRFFPNGQKTGEALANN